ncbi:MAG TPA: hypothetical protein VMC80_00495, partial [Patescibacteria group bacterium]|nr:hypothetical protein [Patescibacteria group bacterium]
MKEDSKENSIFERLAGKNLNIIKIILLIIILAGIFLLTYSPHLTTHFPIHIDEWHSIQQAINLANKTYSLGNISGLEIGFDFFLFIIGKLVNLILAYQFFPAIWAVISAAVLFFTVYSFTDRNFLISILSTIFFGSIRSDQNLTGIWFFTPLAFSIPFIILYMFFFAKGLREQKREYILLSLGLMMLLVFIHAISVLFAIPILILSGLFYWKFVKKEAWTFLLFLLIPIS